MRQSRMDDFAGIELSPPLRQAVEALGFERMTPVQAASLPHLLQGRDVIAQARTEDLTLVSADPWFRRYDVELLPA